MRIEINLVIKPRVVNKASFCLPYLHTLLVDRPGLRLRGPDFKGRRRKKVSMFILDYVAFRSERIFEIGKGLLDKSL